MQYKAHPGESHPLGTNIKADGVNFAIYSKRAEFLELLLFESADSQTPSQVFKLSSEHNRTSNYWHIFLEGCKAEQVYAWRAHGAYEPQSGLRFDPGKILLDPYSKGIVGWNHYSRKDACIPGDNCASSLRSVVLDCGSYDWEGVKSPANPYSTTVIYELHVGGFTRNPNSGVSPEKRGTYAGLVEKLPYLKDLGVTAIELMPVQAFDKSDAPAGLTNYWGYSPIGFFAPHLEYSSKKTALGAINEFRDMVKACHRNGLEVILDVVFNHSSENDENGPTFSFKGLDNLTYYTLDEVDGSYKNFSGCGNTLRTEHPIVGTLILDALRFWVQDMHVDGFRFDLASVLSRDIFGKPAERPVVLWAIGSDPVLASSKLILEAWDSAGLYQVGWYIRRGNRFAEWNGPFRDDVRSFVRGDNHSVTRLADRLTGSSDLYEQNRDPSRSIHFVSCHDGFTLNDLVSYNQKHNEANLENNRDGRDDNYSWNCGFEGATDDESIEALRIKQIKNMLAILMLAPGTPMLAMGDETRRTLSGNNNPYCQDNETNWFDWSLVSKNHNLLNFTRDLIKLRKRLAGSEKQDLKQENNDLDSHHVGMVPAPAPSPALKWHGVKPGEPDFSTDSHSLAFEINDERSAEHVYAVFNAYWKPLIFRLPAPPEGESWHKILDTSLSYPCDLVEMKTAPTLTGNCLTVDSRSSILLINTTALSIENKIRASRAQHPERSITWTSVKKPFSHS